MEEVEKVRVLVCGDSEVGKKSLTGRFTSAGGARTSTLSTIGKACPVPFDSVAVEHVIMCCSS